MPARVPQIKFPNGRTIPAFGLGTWQSEKGDVRDAVKEAFKIGYRHIDTAICYQNQKDIGQAIAESIKEGLVKREEIFLTSKVWNTYHSYARAKEAINLILSELGVDYMDLVLIHWPQAYAEDTQDLFPKDKDGKQRHADIDFVDTWRAMREAVEQGKIRSIGVSNFNWKQIQRLLDAYPDDKIPVCTNQVEMHPYLQQKKLRDYCQSKGITVTAYSPLGNPSFFMKDGPNLLQEPMLIELGKKYNKTAAQVILRWFVDIGVIVIPKSANPKRLKENFDIFDFKLTEEDLSAISAIDKKKRLLLIDWDVEHKEYPFKEEF